MTSTHPSSNSQQPSDLVWSAKLESSRSLLVLLQTLAFGKDEHVNFVVSSKGVRCAVEQARSLQGNVVFDVEVFQEYHWSSDNEEEQFAVPLQTLLDCLSVYGPSSNNTTLNIGYTGYGKPLILALEENGIETACGLRTLDVFPTLKYDIRSAELCCRVIMKSASLRDAFNEVDWTNDYLTWMIYPQAPYFRLRAHGSGASCVVDYPKDSEIFEVYESYKPCEFKYKMNLLIPCLKALTIARKTQVRINSLGLLSMQHLITAESGSSSFVDFYVVPREDDSESE